jgi:hypothetical protein
MHTCVYRGEYSYIYINSIYVYTVFLTNFNPKGRTGPTENYY